MKKINKYLVAAFAAVLSAGLFSCVEEAPEYTPGEADDPNTYGVYFPTQAAAGDHTFDPTMEKVITITAARTNTNGEITVPVEVNDSNGVYTVEPIVFADGQTETTFKVTFPNAETAVKYPLTISVKEAPYCSLYQNNLTAITLSAFCVEWKYFAVDANGKETVAATEEGATKITWTQDWWGETATGYVKYYEVNGVRYCQTVTKTHSDSEGYGFFGTAENEGDGEWTFGWYPSLKNSINGQFLDLYAQYTGWYHSNYGAEVWVYDWRGYWNVLNGNYDFSFNDFATKYGDVAGSYPLGYYDGNGGFYFYIRSYYMDGIGGWGVESYDIIGIADGFTRVDYSIEAEAYETVDGVAPVEFTLGADVDAVKYAVVEGELSDKDATKVADGIIAGTAENVVVADTATLAQNGNVVGVKAAASGIYTLVAVSYAKEEAKESAFTSFTYVTAEDKDEYACVLTVGTEATSALYARLGNTNVNSFAYYVYGSDLTAVKVGVFKTATVEANGLEACVAALKVKDAEVLAAVNGTGYATLATGLDALTSYTVVAWATNDYNSTITTATYTTDGLPLEPVGKGDYTYSKFWEGNDPGLVFSSNPNYANTYAISNWGGGIDFTFTWNKETNQVKVLDQFTGYTHASYGDVWVMECNDYSEKLTDLSFFDPETQTFNFSVIYYVSAGYSGYGYETFKLGEATAATARRFAGAELNTSMSGHKAPWMMIPVERNPQTVAFEVVKAQKPATGRDSKIVKINMESIF